MKNRDYKNILVVRTDRIGDVVLTTPALQALRMFYPAAKISMLVTPQTKDIVEGNPCLDEVIVYDMKGADHGFVGFWKFVFALRRRKFDLAINYHLKKRTNAMLFHAGIPCRIGFANGKFGFMLTEQFSDPRTDGTKHEADYCLALLEHIGVVAPAGLALQVAVKNESELWADAFFKQKGLRPSDKIVAVHPGASCVSKRWPAERFAEVINKLSQQHSVKIILIGAKDNRPVAQNVLAACQTPVTDLTGQTTISQLISVLKRCCLLISNDSGPVHLAVGVKTPVVSIFGRNQPGLSVARWRPLGAGDVSLHKDAGCKICLAHNCVRDFECLQAISVDEVVAAAVPLLGP